MDYIISIISQDIFVLGSYENLSSQNYKVPILLMVHSSKKTVWSRYAQKKMQLLIRTLNQCTLQNSLNSSSALISLSLVLLKLKTSSFFTTVCQNDSVTEIINHPLIFQPITKQLFIFWWSAICDCPLAEYFRRTGISSN